MTGHEASDFFSDGNWNEWPDLDLLEDDPELDLELEDEREPA
jgi:hypothetical protein